jgi:signal transduction histidine kinase
LTAPNPGASFKFKLWASYLSALLVLSLGAAAVIQNQEMSEAVQRASSLRVIIRQLLETEISLLNAETGQRGYLLTGELRYRQPYDTASVRLEHQLDALKKLVQLDPSQLNAVEELGRLSRLKLTELGATLHAYDNGADAVALVKLDSGQIVMEQIRAQIAALAQRARTQRDQQEHRAAALHAFTQRFVGIGCVLAFGLAVAITFWIGTAFRESQTARELLERHALALEENGARLAVQERTLATRLQSERRLSAHLERTNTALQRSNSDLEFFAYMASHDLRAPLRGIANVSDWIEQDLGDGVSEEIKHHLQTMRGRVQRLEGLIAAIAAYTRAGQAPQQVERVDLEELMQDLVDGLAKPRDVQIQWDKPLPTLQTFRQPLHQILGNLLSNAVKHGAAGGGWVTLQVSDAGPYWTFTVSDNGPGIPAEYHGKVFGLFQTLAARDRVEGAGMGLAIVKKLVDQYAGEITLSSSAGQGARFVVKWPKEISDHKSNLVHDRTGGQDHERPLGG